MEVSQTKKIGDPNHPIQHKIQIENKKYWQNRFLFGMEFFEFVNDLSLFWDTGYVIPHKVPNRNQDSHIVKFAPRNPSNQPYPSQQLPIDTTLDLREQHIDNFAHLDDAQHEVFKFTSSFYLTILIRAANKLYVPQIVDTLKSYINHSERNAIWFIEQFSNVEVFKEILLQPFGVEMPKLTIGLIYCAMLKIYEGQKNMLRNYFREGSQQEVGTLGNFILLLISQIFNIKPFVFNWPHYFQIIARFSSLGPEAKEFLLRARFAGRAMELFFEGETPHHDHFSDMEDLGSLQENSSPDIGLPTQVDYENRTYFQQLQERRRMEILSGSEPKYKYMIEAVSNTISVIQSDYDLGEFTLSDEQILMFSPPPKFLRRVFSEAKRNRSMNALIKAQIHFSQIFPQKLDVLIQTLLHGVNESDYDTVRPFLVLFEALMENQSKEFAIKKDAWLKQFLMTVQKNSDYFRFMEVIFEFIFKITSRSQGVKEWFYSNPEQWQFLYQWLLANQKPPHPSSINGPRLFKEQRSINQYDNVSASRYNFNSTYRLRKMQELKLKQVPDLSAELDLDRMDFQDFKFEVGDVVTIYNRKLDSASTWRVVQVLDEMLNIQSFHKDQTGNHLTRWQRCDTDKLIVGEGYKNLTKVKLKNQILLERQQQLEQQRQVQLRSSDEGVQEGQGEQGEHESGDFEKSGSSSGYGSSDEQAAN